MKNLVMIRDNVERTINNNSKKYKNISCYLDLICYMAITTIIVIRFCFTNYTTILIWVNILYFIFLIFLTPLTIIILKIYKRFIDDFEFFYPLGWPHLFACILLMIYLCIMDLTKFKKKRIKLIRDKTYIDHITLLRYFGFYHLQVMIYIFNLGYIFFKKIKNWTFIYILNFVCVSGYIIIHENAKALWPTKNIFFCAFGIINLIIFFINIGKKLKIRRYFLF